MLGDRWGVTDAECAQRYPCDDLVPAPVLQAWRGVGVRAPAAAVWPWVGQLRLAPYSYDLVDNLGRRSPQHLAGLPEPVVGEPFSRSFGRPLGRIVAVEPGAALTATVLGAVLSYLVVPTGEGSRLLLKVVLADGRWLAPAVALGDLVMARRQLLNLAGLAERTVRAAPVSGGRPGGPAGAPRRAGRDRARAGGRRPAAGRRDRG